MPLKADAASGRVTYTVPEAGFLSIRTHDETCTVLVGDRDLGVPPIAEQRVASGTHRVSLRCPDGSTRGTTVTLRPGERRVEVIR